MFQKDKLDWIGVRFLDANVRTFYFEDKFYKAVFPDKQEYVSSLFSNGLIQRLEEMELIPKTRKCDLTVEGFAYVLEQYTEYFNILPKHWNPLLLKDSGLLFLHLNKELAKDGLGTIDGHPYNIVVQKNCRPFWCDIGSIVPLRDNPLLGLNEFIRHFVYPMLIRAKSLHFDKISKFLMEAGCTPEEAQFFLGETIPVSTDRLEMLEKLERLVERIEFAWQKTTWKGYHGELLWNSTDPEDAVVQAGAQSRAAMLKRIIRLMRPKRVVDFGANGGYFSQVAAHTGAEVLAVELDEGACAECYDNFNKSPETARMKVAQSALYAPEKLPDLALALALSHHLFFTHHYRFEVMAKVFAATTSRHLITEFMPNGLGVGKTRPNPLPSDYKLEIFVQELQRYFEHVEVVTYPEYHHRVLLICRNKKA
ncbi:methyltransferase domain-containing protein [Desulfocurvus sp. DL9XJH121]